MVITILTADVFTQNVLIRSIRMHAAEFQHNQTFFILLVQDYVFFLAIQIQKC